MFIAMSATTTECACVVCGTDLDPDEFAHTEDADICGYCFTDQLNRIRERRGERYANGLNETGRHRERCFQASIEIYLDHARKTGDTRGVSIYSKILRLIES